MVKLNFPCLLDFLGCFNINTSSGFAQLSLVCPPFGHSCVSLTSSTLLWRTLPSWVMLPHMLVSPGCCLAGSVCAGNQTSSKGGCPSSCLPLPFLSILHLPSGREKYVLVIIQNTTCKLDTFYPLYFVTIKTLCFFLKYFAFIFMCLSLWCFYLDIAKDLLLFRTNGNNSLNHTRYYHKIPVRGKLYLVYGHIK